ncbi:MAG: TIGR03013 family XrtA/PEP-CTERM system glycosyltransferase [Thermodesulfobacteriota bacterium]
MPPSIPSSTLEDSPDNILLAGSQLLAASYATPRSLGNRLRLYILKKYYPVRNVLFCFGEGALIFLAINLAYLAMSSWPIYRIDAAANGSRALAVTAVFQLSLYFFDLYNLDNIGTRSAECLPRITRAFGSGCIVLGGIYYLVPEMVISTTVFWASYLAICLFIIGWRLLYGTILQRRLFALPVVILGTGKLAAEIVSEIEGKHHSGYKVAAFVGQEPPIDNPHKAPLFTDHDQLLGVCHKLGAERIVVALDDRRGSMPLNDLLHCKLQGVEIEDGITFYEGITGKIMVTKVNPAWLTFSQGFRSGPIRYLIKRLTDIGCSLGGLLVSLPVTLVTALLIKLETPGPIFYLQERVGEKGKSFKVIKFRSMGQNAEKNGAVWAQKNDPRVTKVGAFIRKTRIDEIPQMWNVLKGEMSFVGPRPERPVFVDNLTKSIPYYTLRHSVRPGITGWAQVCYPYGDTEEDALRKLEYDLYYIKNLSVLLDFLVIFKTFKTILRREGSR